MAARELGACQSLQAQGNWGNISHWGPEKAQFYTSISRQVMHFGLRTDPSLQSSKQVIGIHMYGELVSFAANLKRYL